MAQKANTAISEQARLEENEGVSLAFASSEEERSTTIESASLPTQAYLFAPITRIYQESWEVEGVATSEEVDSYGTVFSYEASKKAFQQWSSKNANVREMHNRLAVGKGIHWRPDDENRQIIVRTRVSRGAADTWQKILDNVLVGYSVGAIKPKWGTIERNGKNYPYLQEYELAELSLVDNPSNPDCAIALARIGDSEVDLSEVVDLSEESKREETSPTPPIPETVERVGARLSGQTQQAMHQAIENTLQSLLTLMTTCNCEGCQARCERLSESGDGRTIDASYVQIAERIIEEVQKRLSVPTQRLQLIAGNLARSHTSAPVIDLAPLTTQLTSIETRLAAVAEKSSIDEVRSALAEVRDRVDRIADQPQAGGPMLNAAVIPVDKRFAGDPHISDLPTKEQQYALLEHLRQRGAFRTQDDQLAAAALMIQSANGMR